MTPPIPFVNSISDLLSATLSSPSTTVRNAARKAFATMSDYFEIHCPTKNEEAAEKARA
jgi:hypothetical protein